MAKKPISKEITAEEGRLLKLLYDARERAPDAGFTSQAGFAEKFDIGNQSLLTQHFNGNTPLSLDAAIKYCEALGVRLDDFSPRLAGIVRSAAPLLVRRPPTNLSFTRSQKETLSPIEQQLVFFFRGSSYDHQDSLLTLANKQYDIDNPGASASNPFDGKTPPSKGGSKAPACSSRR